MSETSMNNGRDVTREQSIKDQQNLAPYSAAIGAWFNTALELDKASKRRLHRLQSSTLFSR
jgi:hypothetical protein